MTWTRAATIVADALTLWRYNRAARRQERVDEIHDPETCLERLALLGGQRTARIVPFDGVRRNGKHGSGFLPKSRTY